MFIVTETRKKEKSVGNVFYASEMLIIVSHRRIYVFGNMKIKPLPSIIIVRHYYLLISDYFF
jgi:hypothetical protein